MGSISSTIQPHHQYCKTSEHSNADFVSRLPIGQDPNFDKNENTDNVDTVCIIEAVSLQVRPTDSGTLLRVFSRSNFDEGHAFHQRTLARAKRRL